MDKMYIVTALSELHRLEYKDRMALLEDHKKRYGELTTNIQEQCNSDGWHELIRSWQPMAFGNIEIDKCYWCGYVKGVE
jgi:hypothetical protein